jgi:hypothetical protein
VQTLCKTAKKKLIQAIALTDNSLLTGLRKDETPSDLSRFAGVINRVTFPFFVANQLGLAHEVQGTHQRPQEKSAIQGYSLDSGHANNWIRRLRCGSG